MIMSTHQMHQVEELCDRILLVNQGRRVLYGDLAEIRRRFSGHEVLVQTGDDHPEILAGVPGVVELSPHNGAIKLRLEEQATPNQVLRSLLAAGVDLHYFEVATPSLSEIFIRVVRGGELREDPAHGMAGAGGLP